MRSLRRLLALLALVSTVLVSAPLQVYAAQPGEEIINSSGTLNAQQQISIPVFTAGPANIRFALTGGSPSDMASITVQGGPQLVASSGETVWGFATLGASSTLVIHNTSNAALSYTLQVFARGIIPNLTTDTQVWSGVSQGTGANSMIQFDAPTAGLYQFAFGLSAGGYQFRADNNHLLKNIASGNVPAPAESVYYLAAGTHTFTVLQDPGLPSTSWSVQITPVGGLDTLPVHEFGANLGASSAFDEEWIPIQVAEGAEVNVAVTVDAPAAGDALMLELYNGQAKVAERMILAGETQWLLTNLAAGANMVHVMAGPGNSQPVNYSIDVFAIPDAPASWQGVTAGAQSAANQSVIHLNFPESSIYTFNLAALGGRYQFVLDSMYLQKTVFTSTPDVLTAYVPAGTHTLRILQDTSEPMNTWSVSIVDAAVPHDTLPVTRSGATLGGAENDFSEEWLPLQFGADQRVNLRVAVEGVADDALHLELYNGPTMVYSAPMVYSGEIFWATAEVMSGTNRLHLVADAGNSSDLNYDVTLTAVPEVPASWNGVSQQDGLHPTVQVIAPVTGVYDLVLVTTEGSGLLQISDATSATLLTNADSLSSLNTITTTQRVSLNAGSYNITLLQDTIAPQTVWQLNTSLRRTSAPLTATLLLPAGVPVGVDTMVMVEGEGLSSVTRIELIDGQGAITTINALTVNSDNSLSFTAPASLAAGVYQVSLFDQLNNVVVVPQKLVVGHQIFVPLVRKGQ